VARAALREPDLPVAVLVGPEQEVRLLADHRDDLVGERGHIQKRLRWHLHDLECGLELPPGCWTATCGSSASKRRCTACRPAHAAA